jgi:hypothetical protein
LVDPRVGGADWGRHEVARPPHQVGTLLRPKIKYPTARKSERLGTCRRAGRVNRPLSGGPGVSVIEGAGC